MATRLLANNKLISKDALLGLFMFPLSGTFTISLYSTCNYRYCIAGIYCESFNFAKFVILNALATIKASTHFWICISYMYISLVVDKLIKNC